jgi:hypothetical protein
MFSSYLKRTAFSNFWKLASLRSIKRDKRKKWVKDNTQTYTRKLKILWKCNEHHKIEKAEIRPRYLLQKSARTRTRLRLIKMYELGKFYEHFMYRARYVEIRPLVEKNGFCCADECRFFEMKFGIKYGESDPFIQPKTKKDKKLLN